LFLSIFGIFNQFFHHNFTPALKFPKKISFVLKTSQTKIMNYGEEDERL